MAMSALVFLALLAGGGRTAVRKDGTVEALNRARHDRRDELLVELGCRCRRQVEMVYQSISGTGIRLMLQKRRSMVAGRGRTDRKLALLLAALGNPAALDVGRVEVVESQKVVSRRKVVDASRRDGRFGAAREEAWRSAMGGGGARGAGGRSRSSPDADDDTLLAAILLAGGPFRLTRRLEGRARHPASSRR